VFQRKKTAKNIIARKNFSEVASQRKTNTPSPSHPHSVSLIFFHYFLFAENLSLFYLSLICTHTVISYFFPVGVFIQTVKKVWVLILKRFLSTFFNRFARKTVSSISQKKSKKNGTCGTIN
jgi:hypothetical protein